MALLAYDELNKFPMFHLLSLEYCHIVGETLNIYIYIYMLAEQKNQKIIIYTCLLRFLEL